MTRLACDEDFDGRYFHALQTRRPEWEPVRVQDIGLGGEEGGRDPAILEWAATNDLIVLTQDRTTMTAHAHARLAAGQPMPGLIVVKGRTPVAQVIEDICLLVECGPAAWDTLIVFVPIR